MMVYSLALTRGSRNLASVRGSRSPARMASIIARPETPRYAADRMPQLDIHLLQRFQHVLDMFRRKPNQFRRDTATACAPRGWLAPAGRTPAANQPSAENCDHWQSSTSVFFPGTFLKCRALTGSASRSAGTATKISVAPISMPAVSAYGIGNESLFYPLLGALPPLRLAGCIPYAAYRSRLLCHRLPPVFRSAATAAQGPRRKSILLNEIKVLQNLHLVITELSAGPGNPSSLPESTSPRTGPPALRAVLSDWPVFDDASRTPPIRAENKRPNAICEPSSRRRRATLTPGRALCPRSFTFECGFGRARVRRLWGMNPKQNLRNETTWSDSDPPWR